VAVVVTAASALTLAMSGRTRPGPPVQDDLRRALREWTFSDLIRNRKEPPPDLAPVVRWLEQNTIQMADPFR
jgi:hypothetical protein